MTARVYLKRGAAYAWLSQFDHAVDDLVEAIKFKDVFNDHERAKIEADIAVIRNRKESQEIKLKGDIAFAQNLLDDSLKYYQEAIELDPLNEYALSNIGVIHLKRQEYDSCLQYVSASLKIIEEF
jgi:tetratricopeptide (TPR) repeat protein